MTAAEPPATYRLRSAPVVAFGCLAAAITGAELGGATLMLGGALFSGTPVIDYREYPSGLPDLLAALAFWNLFLAPDLLFGLLLIAWPALAAAARWRPAWIGPKQVYALGVASAAVGEAMTTTFAGIAIWDAVPLSSILLAIPGALIMGAFHGLPAAVPAPDRTSKDFDGSGGAGRRVTPRRQSSFAGSMVTLSPQPQASVSFGLWKVNLAASRLTS